MIVLLLALAILVAAVGFLLGFVASGHVRIEPVWRALEVTNTDSAALKLRATLRRHYSVVAELCPLRGSILQTCGNDSGRNDRFHSHCLVRPTILLGGHLQESLVKHRAC
jgi:hypothetical protein